MKITHGDQTIDLFPNEIPEVCPISLSGGLDSASLMYLVSTHFPDIQLIPYTCLDLNAPKDADAAKEIVEWMQKKFPKNNIPDIEIYPFNDKNEDYVTFEQCDATIEKYPQFKGMRRRQVSKIIQVDQISWQMMKRFPGCIRLDGMTRNPPKEEMEAGNFWHKAERRRDKEAEYIEPWRPNKKHPALSIYQPYCNVDKKFVAGVYIENDLMDDLFPMTRSCVGTSPKLTKDFTVECKECFWCEEKAWAFDWDVDALPITWSEPPSHLTKGGPGDKSRPGNVSTATWFNYMDETGKKKAREKDSIVSLAKSQEIFFCDIPFNQIYSEIDGNYGACCFARKSGVMVDEVSLEDWMENSEYMNSIRKEMLTPGSDLKAVKNYCERCVSDEERYGRSRRTNCLKIHTNDPPFWNKIESKVSKFRKTGKFYIRNSKYTELHGLPFEHSERIFEIQLKIYGSECNLDCYMCDYSNSTTRMKSMEKGVITPEIWGSEYANKPDGYFKDVLRDKTKGNIEQIIELAPYTRSIKLIGGEPLIMKKQYEMLNALVEGGHADKIRLKYQTNLTETKAGKHNLLKYIPKFDHVAVVASVDGIGKTIEYMRRRTDWNKVVKNIELCNQYDNAVVDFNALVSFLSVLRFYEVIDWCKENPVIDQLNWAMLEYPYPLRPNNLPKPIKDELIPKYKDWPDIVAILEKPADPNVDLQDIFEYLILQDLYYKGTKWEMNLFDVFPELEPYYKPRKMTKQRTRTIASWNKQQIESDAEEILM
tara:strand:+ start:10567 stop:12855 length:2289 start_codon:yes stop_codon:yes gene_type:complete